MTWQGKKRLLALWLPVSQTSALFADLFRRVAVVLLRIQPPSCVLRSTFRKEMTNREGHCGQKFPASREFPRFVIRMTQMCRSPTHTVREQAQISRSLRCTRRSRWAEDMTNTLNYIPQKPRRILSESFIREHSASSRETRSSGTSSFLSCTLTTTVQWLSLDISEFYTEQSDCMYQQIYDWSRYAEIVWWRDTVSSNTKMEQKEWDGFAKKRSECDDATVIFSCTRILLINKVYICLRISLFIGIHFLL